MDVIAFSFIREPTLDERCSHTFDDHVRALQHFGADPNHHPACRFQQRDSFDVP
jgi:hypothetical protein